MDAKLGSQRPYYAQGGSKAWIWWTFIGLAIGWLSWSEIGKAVREEATKATIARIPPGEEWKLELPWKWGAEPGTIRAGRRPKLVRDSEVYNAGLRSFMKEAMGKCRYFTETVKENWVTHWRKDPKQMRTLIGYCIRDQAFGAKSKFPEKEGEVGYIGYVKDPMGVGNELGLITYGYPVTGRELKMTTQNLGNWMMNPLSKPKYEVVR